MEEVAPEIERNLRTNANTFLLRLALDLIIPQIFAWLVPLFYVNALTRLPHSHFAPNDVFVATPHSSARRVAEG